MSDRLFFAACGLIAVLTVAAALAWPQGLGTRSPPPFGHAPLQAAPATPSVLPIR